MTALPDIPGVLCYVDTHRAFFTTAPLADQWGDDWDDAPYEHNAGTPYSHEPGVVVTEVWFDAGAMQPPESSPPWTRWSVKQINARATPWLSTECPWSNWTGEHIHIWADTTFPEFHAALVKAGGSAMVRLDGRAAA